MDNSELNACESSVACRRQGRVEKSAFSRRLRLETRTFISPEFLCLVDQRLPSVHGLHAEDRVVALRLSRANLLLFLCLRFQPYHWCPLTHYLHSRRCRGLTQVVEAAEVVDNKIEPSGAPRQKALHSVPTDAQTCDQMERLFRPKSSLCTWPVI